MLRNFCYFTISSILTSTCWVLEFCHLNSCMLGARRQTQRLPDCRREQDWALNELCKRQAFVSHPKSQVSTSTRQTESQPSPKPECPVCTFNRRKRSCYITLCNPRKSKLLSFLYVLSRNANSSHLPSQILWISTDGKIILNGTER